MKRIDNTTAAKEELDTTLPPFVESVKATYPFYAIRLLGGLLYLGGMLIMLYNTMKTVADARAVDAAIPAPAHA